MSGKIDPKDVSAPTHLDGTPVDKEEAARVHAGLVSGEMEVHASPEALAEMEKAGLSLEDIKEMLIAASRKTMS